MCHLIRFYAPRWVTHKLENNNITEVLPHKWECRAPQKAPQLRALVLGGRAPGALGSEGQWGLRTGAQQGWGKQTPLLEVHPRCTGPARSSGLTGAGQTHLLASGGSQWRGAGRSCASSWGHGHSWWRYEGVSVYVNSGPGQTPCLTP